MKRLKAILMAGGIIMSLTAAAPAQAINVFPICGVNSQSEICKASDDKDATSMTKRIINVLLFALGIIAVFMIIWSGIKYTTSRGDAGSVKAAKDTLTYAIVGLIVALLAYSIVNFVVGALK